jgi:flagellar FliL protein
MADQPQPAETAASSAGKSTTITRLTVLALILAVVGAECLLAVMYVPSMGSASLPAAPAAAEPTPAEDIAQPEVSRREVELGQYSITAFQPSSNMTLLIDFRLFGTVACKPDDEAPAEGEAGKADDEFSKLFERHKHRIRDQVITIVRSAEMTDFADPSLGLIRRKILEKSNRTLGKPLLEEVIFSDFSLIEQ